MRPLWLEFVVPSTSGADVDSRCFLAVDNHGYAGVVLGGVIGPGLLPGCSPRTADPEVVEHTDTALEHQVGDPKLGISGEVEFLAKCAVVIAPDCGRNEQPVGIAELLFHKRSNRLGGDEVFIYELVGGGLLRSGARRKDLTGGFDLLTIVVEILETNRCSGTQ